MQKWRNKGLDSSFLCRQAERSWAGSLKFPSDLVGTVQSTTKPFLEYLLLFGSGRFWVVTRPWRIHGFASLLRGPFPWRWLSFFADLWWRVTATSWLPVSNILDPSFKKADLKEWITRGRKSGRKAETITQWKNKVVLVTWGKYHQAAGSGLSHWVLDKFLDINIARKCVIGTHQPFLFLSLQCHITTKHWTWNQEIWIWI